MRCYGNLRIDESEIGTKFGKRTQIGATFSLPRQCGKKYRVAIVQCVCGDVALLPLIDLRGSVTGGCRRCAHSKRKHGLSASSEYRIWTAIKQRCTNPKNLAFLNYGGRGITICNEWLNSFEAFYEYMGPRPSPKHEIDRINNDGPYAPGNVRWVTASKNCRNKRCNRLFLFQGEQRSVAEISELSGVRRRILYSRLDHGMSIEEAITN